MTQDNQETETTPTAKALPSSSGSRKFHYGDKVKAITKYDGYRRGRFVNMNKHGEVTITEEDGTHFQAWECNVYFENGEDSHEVG